MIPRPLFAILAVALLSSVAAPAMGGLAVYTGAGPSERSSDSGTCADLTTVTVYPSVLAPGLHAAEIECVFVWPFNTRSALVGTSNMPSHVMYDLEGSAETGFRGSGMATAHGSSPGTSHWAIEIGPPSASAAWRLDVVFFPEGGAEPSVSWWRGTADFLGASG